MILTTMLDDTIVKKFSFILKCLWRIVIINKVRMQLSWKVDIFIHSKTNIGATLRLVLDGTCIDTGNRIHRQGTLRRQKRLNLGILFHVG
jgi:hypothetical protein